MMSKRRARFWPKFGIAEGGPCPVCARTMKPEGSYGLSASLDHRLPRVRGGTDAHSNLRPMCATCNAGIAISGHCIGAWACVIAIHGNPLRPSKAEKFWWQVLHNPQQEAA